MFTIKNYRNNIENDEKLFIVLYLTGKNKLILKISENIDINITELV